MNFTFILLLKATAILSVSSLLLFVLRRASASLRHWILSLTLIGLLFLPFFITSLPSWKIETKAAKVLEELPLLQPPLGAPALSSNPITPQSDHIARTPSLISLTTTGGDSSFPWVSVLLCVWIAGGLLILIRLFSGIYRIRKISRLAVPFSHPALQNQRSYQLLISDHIQTPMTWGFIRPVILLPINAKDWSLETLRTVIQHEAAHIQRGDYLVHILSWISVAVYWFHPLIWWFKKRQQIEREKACDEYVLNSGLTQQKYAETLVQVARNLSEQTTFNPALPIAQFAEIKNRLLAILAFQRDRFHFTRLTQFQWGSFYAGSILLLAILMPVRPAELMEMIAPDLPITEFLKIESSVEKEDEPLSDFPEPSKSVKPEEIISAERRLTKSAKLLPGVGTSKLQSTVPSPPLKVGRPFLAQAKSESAQVTNPEKEKKAYHGKWTEGKSTFEVWTVGDIIHSPELPYLEVATPEDMIVIEEKRKTIFGIDRYLMIITKAAFNGGLIISFRDGKPNAWNGSYKKSDPLFLYFKENESLFLSKQKTKWITEKLPQVAGNIYTAANDKKNWTSIPVGDTKIQEYQKLKAQYYRPYDALPLNDFEHLPYWKNMRHLENPPFDFSNVPVAPRKNRNKVAMRKPKKIGGIKANRSTSGGNAINEKQKFGTLIPNLPEAATLKDLNFHLRQNDFEKITFTLNLYETNEAGIQYLLNAEPITFEVSEQGWINVDLSDYDLISSGDVLVLLELSKLKGRIGQDFIFFSLAKGRYQNFHEITDQEWGFWEGNFAWYLTYQ